MKKSPPKAVLISDVHYSTKNLELSDKSFRAAIDKAAELKVPLIDCGDLTNDKAILRAEVVNALIDTFNYAACRGVEIYCLVGNHSLINEKGEDHALHFLEPYAKIIDQPLAYDELPNIVFIPYQNDPTNYLNIIKQKANKGDILIMHQGVNGGNMGDYIQDKSAIDASILVSHKCFSGHYHKHHDVGTLTYVGNPFTMSFGEAEDGNKGLLVLNEDGTYERHILNLRRHIKQEYVWDADYRSFMAMAPINSAGIRLYAKPEKDDLVWVKIQGPASVLSSTTHKDFIYIIGHNGFKLDKVETSNSQEQATKITSAEEMLDILIESMPESREIKKSLKDMWRNAV